MAEPRPSPTQRKRVILRAAGFCEYCLCQSRYSSDPFAVEHIEPRSRGGRTRLPNLALSCHGCNGFKHAHMDGPDPTTGLAAPLFHPRRDQWGDHFRWSADYALIVGITPTGRATVERLQLNREGIVNLRRALLSIGAHPPLRRQSSVRR